MVQTNDTIKVMNEILTYYQLMYLAKLNHILKYTLKINYSFKHDATDYTLTRMGKWVEGRGTQAEFSTSLDNKIRINFMLIPTGYYEYSQETVIFYNLDDDKHKAKLTDVAKAMGIEKSEANFINSLQI